MTDPLPWRALLDINIILDWLLDRAPWATAAQPQWDAREAGVLVAYLPASTLTDVFYITRRATDMPTAFAAIDRLLAGFGLLPVDAALLQHARALPGHDFEDNVQIACATNAQLDLIVTRDPAGFQSAPVPVISPAQIGAHLPQP